jgi:uncharacterized lipoprotein NlpE involved in copper resistance
VTRRLLVLALVVALAGCGNGVMTGTPPPKSSSAKVALLAAPKRPGEVIVRGEASPESHGPFTFDGRYKVRFEQFAPEDPNVDFATQTTFVATADKNAEEDGPGSVKLFHAARRTSGKTVTLHGRLFVDVSFGDFPYAIRFTPVQ